VNFYRRYILRYIHVTNVLRTSSFKTIIVRNLGTSGEHVYWQGSDMLASMGISEIPYSDGNLETVIDKEDLS